MRALKSAIEQVVWFTLHPRHLAKVIQSARILYAVLEHGGQLSDRHRKDLVRDLGEALGPTAGPPANRTIIALVAQGG